MSRPRVAEADFQRHRGCLREVGGDPRRVLGRPGPGLVAPRAPALRGMRGAGSPEAAAGAWRVAGEGRVTEVEDRLTALEASAPDEAASGRALVLRDAVRAARARMATVVTTSTEQTLARDLDEVAAQLEVVLPPAEPPPA